jgi:hypothetical protein
MEVISSVLGKLAFTKGYGAERQGVSANEVLDSAKYEGGVGINE